MAHWSEDSRKLEIVEFQISSLQQLENIQSNEPDVYFFRFPFLRSIKDANCSKIEFEKLSNYCETLNSQSIVCVLTTPADAAILLPHWKKT
jgi:hypothetical protein